MATGMRSPGRGHTIGQLRALKDAGWHNGDTGTEIHAGEGQAHLHRLEQHKADQMVHSHIKKIMSHKTRSQGRAWIPSDRVTFRYINGHVVPFDSGKSEPWL